MIWDGNDKKALCGLAGPMVDLLIAAESGCKRMINNEPFLIKCGLPYR